MSGKQERPSRFIAAREINTEMYEALKALTTYLEDDPESFRIGEPSCRICTSGVTPTDFDRGPCAFHRAKALLAKAEGRAVPDSPKGCE